MSTVSESLSQLEVLVVDCQATAAAPHGHLLEMGWARAGTTTTRAHARLIALPDGEHIPAAVMRLTGISERMAQDGVDAHVAWRELSDEAATLARQPAPTVIHFARFEQPFLRALAGGALPLDMVCTHDIARRLLPDLPRCGVRALAGYFGRAVGALRRSADHVEATAFVWQELVRLLRDEGISTWSALHEWLAGQSRHEAAQAARMADAARRAALIAGCAGHLSHASDETAASCTSARPRRSIIASTATFGSRPACPSGCSRCCRRHVRSRSTSHQAPLEAALIEPDEIKRHRPPYNVALTIENRALWFASPDLSARSAQPSPQCPLGPFPSAGMLDQFAALAAAESRALDVRSLAPDAARSTQVTPGCAQRILSCRASDLSARTKTAAARHTPVARRSTRPRR